MVWEEYTAQVYEDTGKNSSEACPDDYSIQLLAACSQAGRG